MKSPCRHRKNVLGAYCWDCKTNLAMRQHDLSMPVFPTQEVKGKTLEFDDCRLTWKEKRYINHSVMGEPGNY